MYGARLQATRKLVCELTLRNGKVVYDLNGITRPDWETLPKDYKQTGDSRWDSFTPAAANSACLRQEVSAYAHRQGDISSTHQPD